MGGAQDDTTKVVVASSDPDRALWLPSGRVALQVLLVVRLASAYWVPIADCDETYNYWDPTHYLSNGFGFQTWEYSPEFAIRSYAYVGPMALLSWLLQIFGNGDKIAVFYLLRSFLALLSALCEAQMYAGVSSLFSRRISRYFLIFLIFSHGMFIAAPSYLPSSFSMYCIMMAYGSWLETNAAEKHAADMRVVLSLALSSIVGWPFSAALALPIAFEMVILRRQIIYPLIAAVLSVGLFLIPTVTIDFIFYQKLALVPYNIVVYNVFASASGRGPDLYGVEPWTFYVQNLFLNFNFVAAIAIAAPILLILHLFMSYFTSALSEQFSHLLSNNAKDSIGNSPMNVIGAVLLRISPLFLWLAIFFPQPHKEERFLFVIYPLICLAAAVALSECHTFASCFLESMSSQVFLKQKSKENEPSTNKSSWFSESLPSLAVTIFITFFILLSLSRGIGQHISFNAPTEVYSHFYQVEMANSSVITANGKDPKLLCVGREWFRFPSHYFIPGTLDQQHAKVLWLKSEFHGILPKYFEPLPQGTYLVPTEMNDMNREEKGRYSKNSTCDYVIDFRGPTEYVDYTVHPSWEPVYCAPFLDQTRSSSRLLRAFWIPFLSSKYNVYDEYCLMKRNTRK